jgi:hypothetical protein
MYIYRKHEGRKMSGDDNFGCCLKKEHFDGLQTVITGTVDSLSIIRLEGT